MTNEAPTKPTVDEVVNGLTGYDEIAIEDRFGGDINALLSANPIKGMRALAFVVIKRQLEAGDVKSPTAKAYEQIMKSPMSEIADYFAEDTVDDEPFPQDPVTEAGKDG